MLTIHLIAAARPNFMKIAPLYHALKDKTWANPVLVHTGQHYDLNMSDVFFHDLMLPSPDIHLGIGSGSHAEQTGKVMIAYEKILLEHQPDMVIVVGDVNATVACTLAAVKVNYSATHLKTSKNTDFGRPIVAHLEAGLRSFDRDMPEEINRLVTDTLSDVLWTPSIDGNKNLLKEGIAEDKITLVGNIMLDSYEMLRSKIESQTLYSELGFTQEDYAVITLHRPSNVDRKEILEQFCTNIIALSKSIPLCFPIHPRTKKQLIEYDLYSRLSSEDYIILTEPLNYIRFMNLVFNSRMVITDSGGIQEETTYLGIPCLTLRDNTERPITVSHGTNKLCNIDNFHELALEVSKRNFNSPTAIKYWDGKTSNRIIESILFNMNRSSVNTDKFN
jgi:UDP-N-acetylglucosamine 2-epimerase (non-hydrolysing)